MFLPRTESFMVQIMRGLKCEKRFEPGMGHGIFAREKYVSADELIMFDLPFLSLDLEKMPVVVRDSLRDFDAETKIKQVMDTTAEQVAFQSKQSLEKTQAYFVEHNLDVDISWLALIACYGACWCRNTNPNDAIPLNYFSYIDDYYSENEMHQNILDAAYDNIVEITGITPAVYTREDFWITLFKYRSNVYLDTLYPVAPTLINHSCWPNAVFAKDGALVTLRPIEPNEQITVSLYGRDCDDVKAKGLAGKAFKCFTPGCEFSKRVPKPLPPAPERTMDDLDYVTPWHAGHIKMARPLEVRTEDLWKTPAREKFKKMWKEELTVTGRDLGGSPKLPGSKPRRHILLDQPDEHGNLLAIGAGKETKGKQMIAICSPKARESTTL